MKKTLAKIFAVLFTLSVFFICGFIAIMIPANSRSFYTAEFRKNDSVRYVRNQSKYLDDENAKQYVSSITEEQLLDLMMHTIRYCMLIEDDLNIVIDGQYLRVFRADEVSHMADVRGVFQGGIIIVAVSVLVVIAGVVLFIIKRKQYYENCRKVPYWTLGVLVGVLLLIGLFALVNFDIAFEIFHRIFFDGNYTFQSGVMIWMIGFIFEDIVAIIAPAWITLISLFVAVVALTNKKMGNGSSKNRKLG